MKYLARQPILNRARELYACELLFRNSLENSCDQRNLELWEKLSALVSELG
jgi:c-di-GMP-related signal transduction protein